MHCFYIRLDFICWYFIKNFTSIFSSEIDLHVCGIGSGFIKVKMILILQNKCYIFILSFYLNFLYNFLLPFLFPDSPPPRLQHLKPMEPGEG